jgi:translation initiation factor 5A
MDEGGSTREDLKLPTGTDELDKLAGQIKADFAEGKEVIVTVLKV